jgi:DNA end-binding protein Ku
MAPRAVWKGVLKIAELNCPVSLFTAASTSERITFHTLNRKTGNRVQRQYVDEQTGRPVETADQVKGYETGRGGYVVLEPEELAEAVPEGDKTLAVETFVPRDGVDDTFFDRPYYVAPSTAVANESFALLRDGMRERGVAALARALLFRRVRTVLVRPEGNGLLATTLNFDYEIRSADQAFADIPELKLEGEMLDLARHIISTKKGSFDPAEFGDRYEGALAELVRAKIEGREIKPQPKPKATPVSDLMEALRRSAATSDKAAAEPARKRAAKSAEGTPARRKAS